MYVAGAWGWEGRDVVGERAEEVAAPLRRAKKIAVTRAMATAEAQTILWRLEENLESMCCRPTDAVAVARQRRQQCDRKASVRWRAAAALAKRHASDDQNAGANANANVGGL